MFLATIVTPTANVQVLLDLTEEEAAGVRKFAAEVAQLRGCPVKIECTATDTPKND